MRPPARQLVLALLLAAVGHAAQWHADREYRRPIHGGEADTVAVGFCGGGHLASGARDALVVDGRGTALPSQVLFTRRGDLTWLAFQASKARGGAWVYYGGGKTDGRVGRGDWEPKLSLMYMTMPRPPGALESWRPIAAAVRSGNLYGLKFAPNIWTGVNPFGPDDHFASAHVGYLKIDRPGKYRIFTASDEASFVLLNGRELVSWPGIHTVDRGRRAEHGVDIQMPKGLHSIEYYHAEVKDIQFMALGWMRPGAKRYEPIPESAFVHTPIVSAGSPQRREHRPLAACSWEQSDQLLHGEHQYTRVSFVGQSQNAPPKAKVVWSYGDGVVHTGVADDHIYIGDGPFPVTVKLVAEDGKVLDQYHTLVRVTEAMKNFTVQDERPLRQYVATICGADNAKASREAVDAYWELVETEEDTRTVESFVETYVARFGVSGRAWHPADRLALHYSLTEPRKAVPLYGKLAAAAPRPLDAARARMEQIELMLHKLKEPEKALQVAQGVRSSRSGVEARIAAVKIGDVYRAQGDFEKAERAYRAAQSVSYAEMDRRVVAVRQGGLLETVASHVEHGHLRAAREALTLWEIEYPIGKLSGDLILMTAKYFDRLGAPERALAELTTLTRINPLSPYLPEIEYYMARAYGQMGQHRKARELFDKVIQEYPRSRAAQRARREGY